MLLNLVAALVTLCVAGVVSGQVGEVVGPVGEKIVGVEKVVEVSGDDRPLFPAGFMAGGSGGVKRAVAENGEAGGGGSTLSSVAVPLAVVLSLIGGVAWVFRRIVRGGGSLASAIGAGGRAPSGIVEVLGRYPVSRGQTLVLLKLDQRVLLLAQSQGSRSNPGGFTTLSEVTEPQDVASILQKVSESESTGPAARFNAMLAEANGAHGGGAAPRGLRRLASMVNPQPVSWQEPEQAVAEEPTERPFAPEPARSGVDALRLRLANLREGRAAS